MEFNIPSPPSNSKNFRIWYFTTALLILFLAISLGWNIYSFRTNISGSRLDVPSSPASGIFEVQNAFITGEIIGINGNKIIITNKAGTKGELRIADNFSVSDLNENSATPSSDLKNIKTNKTANINAQVIKDEYQITSITYIQDTIDLSKIPPIPPPSSSPAVASESASERE